MSLGQFILDLCALTRIYMCLMAAIAVGAGFYICSVPLSSRVSQIAALSMFWVVAAGFALNAIFDTRQDLMHSPDRPLPSRRMTLALAWTIAFLFLFSGIAVAELMGRSGFYFVIALCLLLTLYSPIKFWWAVSANFTVGIMCASCFLFGPVATGVVTVSSFVIGLICLLYFSGREMVKDGPQRVGDGVAGIRTLAVSCGEEVAYDRGFRLILVAHCCNFLFLLERFVVAWEYWQRGVILGLIIGNTVVLSSLRGYLRRSSPDSIEQFLRTSAFGIPLGIAGFFL